MRATKQRPREPKIRLYHPLRATSSVESPRAAWWWVGTAHQALLANPKQIIQRRVSPEISFWSTDAWWQCPPFRRAGHFFGKLVQTEPPPHLQPFSPRSTPPTNSTMPDVIQIATTTPTKELAQQIALALVERRLAACVQIAGPIESVYRWQGEIETAAEWQCVIKTRAELFSEVESAIRQLHAYAIPEILATPVVAGSSGYLEWLATETQPT